MSSDLEVRVLNTETESQDLSFPQNGPSDSSIQLSASTFKQYSRNGQSQLALSSCPFHLDVRLAPMQFHWSLAKFPLHFTQLWVDNNKPNQINKSAETISSLMVS